jgi:tetratricopeptide (TPR) repeat protein
MNNLAEAYRASGQLDKALPLLEKTLDLRTSRLGPTHPDTLATMNNLAVGCWRGGRLDRSIPLFEACLIAKDKKLGRRHPDTLLAVANLGVNYKDAGRIAEALPLLEEAYRSSSQDTSLRWVGAQLLEAYAQAGKAAEAARLVRDLVADARRQSLQDSSEFADVLSQFALVLLQAHAFAEAESLLRECLTIREKTQPDDWSTFNTLSLLGSALDGQKKYEEAETDLLKGYEGMKQREKQIPHGGSVCIPEAIDRLADHYTALAKHEDVKKWQAERARYPYLAPQPHLKR